MASAVAVVSCGGRGRAQVEGLLFDAVGEERRCCVGGVRPVEQGFGDVGFAGFRGGYCCWGGHCGVGILNFEGIWMREGRMVRGM